MYMNLLVPVSMEEDRNAARAIDIARVLRADNGKITLLHVMEHLPAYATEYLPHDHLAKSRAEIAGSLANLAKGDSVEVVEGHSARTILDWAASHDVDCIVVASHRPGMQDYLLGSTAARVVRHAACAVHVVR